MGAVWFQLPTLRAPRADSPQHLIRGTHVNYSLFLHTLDMEIPQDKKDSLVFGLGHSTLFFWICFSTWEIWRCRRWTKLNTSSISWHQSFFSFTMLDRISHSPGCSQAHYIDSQGWPRTPESPACNSPGLVFQAEHHTWFYMVLEMKLRTSQMQDKRFTNWATFSALHVVTSS